MLTRKTDFEYQLYLDIFLGIAKLQKLIFMKKIKINKNNSLKCFKFQQKKIFVMIFSIVIFLSAVKVR